jgi:Ig-like domain-containing protein
LSADLRNWGSDVKLLGLMVCLLSLTIAPTAWAQQATVLGERRSEIADTPLVWMVETFPSLATAQAAAGPTAIAADIDGQAWLFTVTSRGAASAGIGATRIAELGIGAGGSSRPVKDVAEYVLRATEVRIPPGQSTGLPSDTVSETLYVLRGEVTMPTLGGVTFAQGRSMWRTPSLPLTVSNTTTQETSILLLDLLPSSSVPAAATSSAATPTAVPAPILTSPDCMKFVADVTVPDGTLVTGGATVEKVWRLANCGERRWENHQAVRVQGEFGPSTIEVPPTEPGSTVDLSTSMAVPDGPGTYRAYYQLQGPTGRFGSQFFVEVAIPDCDTPANWDFGALVPSAVEMGTGWCPVPALEQSGPISRARYVNLGDYSAPREARFWVMLAPGREQVLNPLMVLLDLTSPGSSGPGTELPNSQLGDGPSFGLVRVDPERGTSEVYYSFILDRANALVSVSGSSTEVSDITTQADQFATQQQHLLELALGDSQ